MQSYGSLPGSPAAKRPASAGLAAVRAAQALAQGAKGTAGSANSPRQQTATLLPPSSFSSSHQDVPPVGELKSVGVGSPAVVEASSQVQHSTVSCTKQASMPLTDARRLI